MYIFKDYTRQPKVDMDLCEHTALQNSIIYLWACTYVYTHVHTSFISLYLSTDTNFEDFVLCIGTSMFDIVKAWFKPTKKQHKNKFMQNVKLVIN